jgi:hypothetical protein
MPDTPQHNGVMERCNWSLMDITWCLLLDKHLPQFLWMELICAACIILNLWSIKRTLTRPLKNSSLDKSHLLSICGYFGSTVYIQPNKPNPSKLAPRSKNFISLNRVTHVNGYRCYQPSTRRFIISHDVQIMETNGVILDKSTPPDLISGPPMPQVFSPVTLTPLLHFCRLSHHQIQCQ